MKCKHSQVLVNLQLQHVGGHLEWQPLPEMAKMGDIALVLKIETGNKN